MDEADTFLGKGNSDLKGILNSGFSKCSASVLRCDGDDHNARQFSTWCPKLIALIGYLPDTLEDRAIPIRLRRKLADEQVQRFAEHRDARRLHELASKAARWASDNNPELRLVDPDLPTGLNDRAMDCWRPLIAIADAARGDWPTKARNASHSLSVTGSDDDEASIREQLLSNIKQVFDDMGIPSIRSSKLVEKLTENETWPWGEWRRGCPISARGLAKLLKPFGIKPRKASSANEYWRVDFVDDWARYLPPTDPGPPSVNSTSSIPHERDGKNNGLDASATSNLSSTHFHRMEDRSNPQATENIDEWNLGSLEPGTAAQESNSKVETNGFTAPEGVCSDPTSMESEWTEEL